MSSKSVDVQTHLNGIIEKLLSNGVIKNEVQDKYILPPNERPQLSEVSYSESIPVVDLQDLDGPNRTRVVQEIRQACEEDGFFQIVNHGVPEIVMKSMMEIAKEFFEMPVEDRAYLYSEDTNQRVRLCTSFNISKEKVLSWRDYLLHPCHPLEDVMNSWPEKPTAYREIAAKYAVEVRELILRLLAAISEALGLDSDYLNTNFEKHGEGMTINYYPPCPNPDLTLGIQGHSDASAITVLLQDDVNGLQVLKNGKWVAVDPIANAFVINLGDQLQVVSNGRFRSVEHRAITNASTARISIATFYIPSRDTFIAPAASMVDGQHPALYRGYQFEEFMKVFWGQELKSKNVLNHFKIEYPDNNGE
jgi:isopenicillin N synthase-like dioxygenase